MNIMLHAIRRPIIGLFWSAGLFLLLCGSQSPEVALSICRIQGSNRGSPYKHQFVNTLGVVTHDLDTTGEKGFFLQEAHCDDLPETSDAIFVYLGEKADLVSVGDYVRVRGWVVEFYGLTEISVADLAQVSVLGTRPLPAPVEFFPPWDDEAAARYFEAHESMRVAILPSVVVGPTTSRGEAYVVDERWDVRRVFAGTPAGAVLAVASAGTYSLTPDVRVGDRVSAFDGILDVRQRRFLLQMTSTAAVTQGKPPERAVLPASDVLSFASLNLHNLFDALDDPFTRDTVLSGAGYRRKLAKLARLISEDLERPLFLAVQEAENGDVLQALANRPEMTDRYDFAWHDGPDQRGIDVALMYRIDRVELHGVESRQGCTALKDGLGPDGNQDPVNPQNGRTCSLDRTPDFDGNRLFSRPPLLVHLSVCRSDCAEGGERSNYTVIVFHLKSKSQDTAAKAFTAPRRLEQAQFLADLYLEILRDQPHARVILAGDFNDFPDSAPALRVESAGAVRLLDPARNPDQYSYIYNGLSQAIDQVFVSPSLLDMPGMYLAAVPVHIAADYPARLENDPSTSLRASDHDPVLVRMLPFPYQMLFPFVQQQTNHP